MKCPVCGGETPHGHTEYEKELELNCRPAFLRWLLLACERDLYARYYRVGGWGTASAVQRGGPDGCYLYHEIEATWKCWRAAWFHEYPPPKDGEYYHAYLVPKILPKDDPGTTRNVTSPVV